MLHTVRMALSSTQARFRTVKDAERKTSMSSQFHFFPLFLALAISQDAMAADRETPVFDAWAMKPTEILEALRSPNVNAHVAAVKSVRGQRLHTISILYRAATQCTKDSTRSKSADLAMRLLGEIRAEEAVPMLVENIKFTVPPGGGATSIKRFGSMPSVAALISIGLTSLDPLVKKVASADDDVVCERAAIVINQVLGTDMAILFVQDRGEREKDETKRQRLARLVERIDKVERGRRIKTGALDPPPEIRSPRK